MKTIAALFLAATALGASSDARAAQTDENLASTVHVELLTAETVDGTLISVRANDGVITLDGIVGTEQAKSAAERLASDVHGVSRVENRLTVDSALASQAQVAQDLARPDTPARDDAAAGHQAAAGAAADSAQAAGQAAGTGMRAATGGTATADASDCIGARYRSRLLGRPVEQTEAKVSDDELQRRVTNALENDPLLENSDIRVTSASNGKVRLEGSAQAIPVHRHALLTAFHVPGVCRVASDITTPADAAAAAVNPDAENAEAAASTEGAGNDPTAPAAVVPVPVPGGSGAAGTPVED